MIEEKSIQSEIAVLNSGELQIKTLNTIVKDGVVVSSNVHFEVFAPGTDLTGQPENVVAIATAAWTPEVIAAYEAAQAVVE